MKAMRLALLSLLPGLMVAQLIPSGQPVPKGPNPPAVFLNGYQSGCVGDTGFASNFGAADKLLQSSSIVTLYFDNCSVSGNPNIEALGVAFGNYLAGLKYTDGTPVTQVDVVAHSMGGLILRSYLAGKQDKTPATYNPPATVPVRRAVLLGTPNFGSAVISQLGFLGGDKQTTEMALGSQFLFDLSQWNQGTDDLRGISAIAVSGSGGTGVESSLSGFDDGIVTLTSSSLGFSRSGFTRVVPYCHTANSLLTLFGVCKSGTPVLNILSTDPANLVGQILVSFLTGTNAWKSVGTAAEADPLASTRAGVALQLRDKSDQALPVVNGAVAGSTLSANSGSIVYSELLTANTPTDIQLNPMTGSSQTYNFKLPAGTVTAAFVKPGPVIFAKGVVPAAGPAPFPYDVAPGAYVSIYGANLATAPATSGVPYPTQIADVQVLVNGTPAPLQYISPGQINFIYPAVAAGLTQLTVKTINGQNTVNVRVAPAVPSLFLLDAASSSAAVNATTGKVVTASAPLHVGDFVSVYLTGLGTTTATNGLDYATVLPAVTLGGQSVTVTYAGRTPGLAGLDQINFQIPAGVTGMAVPVVVTSGGRPSSTAYLAIQ